MCCCCRACVRVFLVSPVMLGVSIKPRILLVQAKLVYLWFKCVMFGANGNLSDIAEYSISRRVPQAVNVSQ